MNPIKTKLQATGQSLKIKQSIFARGGKMGEKGRLFETALKLKAL
jgi:hypothetical protein